MTESLQALGIGTYDQLFLAAGADKVTAVNAPDDDNTSYLANTGNPRRESYTLQASAIPAGSTINSITVRARIRSNGNLGTAQSFLRLGASEQTGPVNSPGFAFTDYTDTISRPGGGAWALADLATVEIGIEHQTGGFFAILTTTLEASIDYTPAATTGGGAMFLVMA